MSYVITVRAAVENVMLFRLYKIFVGRSCSTPTNHSHEPPLDSYVKILICKLKNLWNRYVCQS